MFSVLLWVISFAGSVSASSVELVGDFEERRGKFVEKLESGSIAILLGNKPHARNHDVNYIFRQESNYFYLTGVDTPDSAAVFFDGDYYLFLPEKGLDDLIWDGPSVDLVRAKELYGADHVRPIGELGKTVAGLIRENSVSHFYYELGSSSVVEKEIEVHKEFRREARRYLDFEPLKFSSAFDIAEEMRLFKSDYELDMIQKAIDITAAGIQAIVEHLSLNPITHEYSLYGALVNAFHNFGVYREAFPAIIGSGPNANILHYEYGTRQTEPGDVVLIDTGAEYAYYAADISRTIPVSGQFSAEQRDVYQSVQAVQEKLVEAIGAEVVDVRVLSSVAKDLMSQQLLELGLITDAESSWQRSLWFPHGVYHWVGLDVHDAGIYWNDEGPRKLEPRMVLAIEPGIYVNPVLYENLSPQMLKEVFRAEVSQDEVDTFRQSIAESYRRYQGIGIRLEDDYVITEDGSARCMSCNIPKNIEEVERSFIGTIRP